MEKAEVLVKLRKTFGGWRGGVECEPGVWYACHPEDLPSKAFVSLHDLYISKVASAACAHFRTAYCMIEEIDTHFCPHDLTNYPGHEAMKNRNRSSKSFECPVCATHLTIHSQSQSSETGTYFSCAWCHWESTNIGLTAPNPEALIRQAAVREKQLALHSETPLEDEKAHLLGQLNKRWAESTRHRELLQRQARGLAYISGAMHGPAPPAKSIEQVEQDWEQRQRALLGGVESEADQSKLTSPARATAEPAGPITALQLDEVSSLKQRLRQPQHQSRQIRELEPRRMDLMTKRSKRCPVSNQLIVKPELNPSKTSFQKKSDAISKVPKLTVVQKPSRNILMLRFTNFFETPVTIRVEPWEPDAGAAPEAAAAEEIQPYLFRVAPFSTTIGETGLLDPAITQPLLPDDDPEKVVSRTSNSVIVKFPSSVAVTTSFMQARIAIIVEGEFFADLPELKQMTCQVIVNADIE